jgi:hypothetical protein
MAQSSQSFENIITEIARMDLARGRKAHVFTTGFKSELYQLSQPEVYLHLI